MSGLDVDDALACSLVLLGSIGDGKMKVSCNKFCLVFNVINKYVRSKIKPLLQVIV